MFNKVKDYKHNNQELYFDETKNTYVLISYNTEVLHIVNGRVTHNDYGKISSTTSKHITQATTWLRLNDKMELSGWNY